MADEKLELKIEGDSRDAQKALDDAQDGAKDLRKEVDKLGDADGPDELLDDLKRMADAMEDVAPPNVAAAYRDIADALADGDPDQYAAGVERFGKALASLEPPDSLAAGMESVSKATQRAAAAGVEGSEKIAKALGRISTASDEVTGSASRADLALEELGETPSEFLGRANSALERQVVLLADARKNVVQMAEEGGEGLAGFADRSAKAQQRIKQLRQEVADSEEQIPGLRAELEKLERQYAETFQKGSKEVVELERSLSRTTAELQAAQGDAVNLLDLIETRAPGAAKALFGVAAAAATFGEAYQQTRQFIETLEKLTGLKIDQQIQRDISAVLDFASATVESEKATQRHVERVDNMIRVLKAQGIEVDGLEEGQRRYREQLAISNDTTQVAEERTRAYYESERLLAHNLSVTTAEFEKRMRVIRDMADEVKKIQGQAADLFGDSLGEDFTGLADDARKLTDIMGFLQGDIRGVDEELRGVAITMGELPERLEELDTFDPAFVDRMVEDAQHLLAFLDKLPPQFKKIFEDQAGRSIEALREDTEDFLKAVDAVGRDGRRAMRDLAEATKGVKAGDLTQEYEALLQIIHAVDDGLGELDDDTIVALLERTKSLRETLEDLPPALREAFEQTAGIDQALGELSEIEARFDAVGRAADEAFDRLVERAANVDLSAVSDQLTDVESTFRGILRAGRDVDDITLDRFARELADLRAELVSMPDDARDLFRETSGRDVKESIKLIDKMADAVGRVATQTEAVKDRLREALDLVPDLLDALDELAEAQDGPEESPLNASLAEAKEQLTDLKRQREDFEATGEIFNLDQLDDQIFEAKRRIGELERAGATVPVELDAGDDFTDLTSRLRETLEGSGIKEIFEILPKSARDSIQAAVQQLEEGLEETGRIDPRAIEDFRQTVVDAMAEAGEGVEGYGRRLESILGGHQRLSDQLDDIRQRAPEAGSAVEEMGQGVVDAAEQVRGGGVIMTEAGEQIAGLGKHARDAASSARDVGTATQEAGAGAQEGAAQVQDAGEKLAELKEQARAGREGADDAAEGLGEVASRGGESASAARSTAEAFDDMGNAGFAAGEGARAAASGAQQATEPVQQLGQAATTAAPALEQTATATERLATATTTLSSGSAAVEVIIAATDAAAAGVEPMSAYAEGATTLSTAITAIAEATEAAPNIKAGGEAAAGATEPTGKLAEQVAELGTHMTTTADGSERLSMSLTSTSTIVGELLTDLPTFSTELGTTGDQASKSAGGIKQVEDAVRGIGEAVRTIPADAQAALTSIEEIKVKVGELATEGERIPKLLEDIKNQGSGAREQLKDLVSEEDVERLARFAGALSQIVQAVSQLASLDPAQIKAVMDAANPE